MSNSFSSQFYSTSILSSSEEETNPVKGHACKAHMKDKEKQGKAKMVQQVTDDKMADGKDTTTKEKKDKVSKEKGAKDWKEAEVSMLIELLEERCSLWYVFNKDYSKCGVKDTAYKEIADIFGHNITSIRDKFNRLRAQYRCEMAKLNKMKSGQSTESFR